MITQTITLHEPDGRISWLWVANAIAPKERYVGTPPWTWIAEEDREIVKVAFALALLGEVREPMRYQLDPAQHGGHWTVETIWVRLPTNAMPVLGISRTFASVIENLSPRERQVAKLLPMMTAKQVARVLDISASTVDSFRRRLADKVGLSGNQLLAWCQDHHEIL